MASRSMHYLRKHSKVILVVMGIVCMITFVVGAALSDLVNSAARRAQNPNPIVVTWAKGKVTSQEMQNLRFRHAKVYEFLQRVIFTAIERGAKPIINGRQVTLDRMQSFDVGIPADNSEESTVQTMVLAAEADRMGVAVDVDAAKNYLRQVSSPELKEGDWFDIATQTIGEDNRLSVNQLLEHLAYELKAQHVRMLALSGYYAQGVGPIVPPGQAYELFGRLNRRFTVEAYPIETENFVNQVKGEPTQSELQELFDKGKNRDPDPNLDEPGFHKPHKLSFKWLKVNFTPFLEEAKKQITEQEIEEAYQKDISQGLHKVQELPPATGPATDEKQEGGQPAADKSVEEKPAEKKPTDKQPADSPLSEKPAESPAVDKADDADKSTGSVQPKDTKNTTEKSEPPKDCDQEAEPEKPSSAPPSTEQQVEPVKPDEKTSSEQPAKEKPNTEQPATEKSADEKPAADAGKPATAPPAEAGTTTPASEPKYKPLAEVRDQILTRLAQPIAEDARKKAVAEVTAAIEKYGKDYRRYQDVKSVKKNADIKEPAKLDLVPLAAKYDFPIGETPLVDRYEVQKTEIGQKVQQFDMAAAQMGQFRMLSFADIAYGQDQPLFRPEEARSSEPDISYVYFRTGEEKAADVTFKEAGEQVLAFWKQRQAYKLALAEANKLAEKAKGAESLTAAVPDATKIITTPPFSWMSTGGFGFGQPELSQVTGIDLAGREFMQSVFSLRPGETGAAPNQSHAKVYVVRVISQDPEEDRLREQFLESGYNQMVLMLAQGEALQTSVDWYRGVADDYRVKWERPPADDRRM